MKITELLGNFSENILYRSVNVPFCNPEKGIKLIMPSLYAEEEGTVFVGSIEDFEALSAMNAVEDGVTYIVCCGDTYPDIPSKKYDCNLIFLHMTLQAALTILRKMIKEKASGNTTDKEKILNEFWNDILQMRIITQEQAAERAKQFPYRMKRHLACIVVKADNGSREISDGIIVNGNKRDNNKGPDENCLPGGIGKITRELRDFFVETNLFYTGKEWIVLYSQDKDTSVELDMDYNAFSTLLDKHCLNAGISYVCQLSEAYRTMYMTAEAAVNLGTVMSIPPYNNRIYTFHQYNLYYILHLSARAYFDIYKNDNLVFLTHPDVTRIYYYDKDNDNNLLEVLFGYLLSGQSAGLTAKNMHMHRNTVINKLNKIEEVLGHKLDFGKDRFLFLISCMIMDYQQNYAKYDISGYFKHHDFGFEE